MRSLDQLHLHEQLLLLALRDRKGTPESGTGYQQYALGGAVFAELALTGWIRIEEGRKALVEAVDGADRPRNEILADALGLVQSSKRPRRATHWVRTFSGLKNLRHRTASGLCRRGILRSTEAKMLIVFSRKAYPTLDPGPERELATCLRTAVSGDGDVDPRLGIVISMAHATGLLRIALGRALIRKRKERLKEIVGGRHLSASGHPAMVTQQAIRTAVEVSQAAVLEVMAAVAEEEAEEAIEHLRRLRGRRF